MHMSQQSVERIRQARDSFEQIRNSVDEIRDQNSQIHTDTQLVEDLARSDSQRLESLSSELNGLLHRFKT